MMPSAVETVEFACHFPGLRVDVTIPVIKPFYAKLGHAVISTGLSLLAGICTSGSGVWGNFRKNNTKNKSNFLRPLAPLPLLPEKQANAVSVETVIFHEPGRPARAGRGDGG
jgi:hypothetical protein